MNAIRYVLGLVVAGVVTAAAHAQSFSGLGLNPGDNVATGLTDTVVVTGVPTLVNFNIEVDVTWTTRHTWVGDVILRLTGPNATTVDLVNRPGRSTTAGFGDDSNFLGTYSFRDSATNRFIDVANTIGAADDNTGDVTPGIFRATNNLTNSVGAPTFSGEEVQTLNTSFGTVGNGNWTLFYSDNAGGDYGEVNGWVIRFVPVPEPASVLAIGAGLVGLAGLARRRFRREPVLA